MGDIPASSDIQYRALLPCPFCGSDAEYTYNSMYGNNSMATCKSCGATAFGAKWNRRAAEIAATLPQDAPQAVQVTGALNFDAFRAANVARCIKWHPAGIASWSPSDWLTAVTGELGELASLLKMRNRERDGLPGNKFSPTDKQVADELADVLTYLDLLAAVLGVNLGQAAVSKFNEVSERVGFPDRIAAQPQAQPPQESMADVCSQCGGTELYHTECGRICHSCGTNLSEIEPEPAQPPAQSHACEPVAWLVHYDVGGKPACCLTDDISELFPHDRVEPLYTHPPAPSPANAQRNWPDDELYSCQCSHCDNEFLGYKRRVVCHACAPCGQELARLRSAASSQRALVDADATLLDAARILSETQNRWRGIPPELKSRMSMWFYATALKQARERTAALDGASDGAKPAGGGEGK
jgi:NTP pyrophosphatase (non-canonical NTP hydrolase)